MLALIFLFLFLLLLCYLFMEESLTKLDHLRCIPVTGEMADFQWIQ